jgi:hypothetical protein
LKLLAKFSGSPYVCGVDRKLSHALVDRINAAQDRLIAAGLRRDGRALNVARMNLRRWMARDGRKVRACFQEWHRILTRLSRAEIADFLQSDTPMARRLRQSNPFAGVLSETERRSIAREKAGS